MMSSKELVCHTIDTEKNFCSLITHKVLPDLSPWNAVPENLRECSCIAAFKKDLKTVKGLYRVCNFI